MQWKWKAWLHTPHATVHSSLVAEAWFAWHSMPAGQHTVTVYMYTVTVYMYTVTVYMHSTVSCTCIWPTHCHYIHVQYSQLYMYMANTLSLYTCTLSLYTCTLSLYTCTVQSAVHVYGQHTVTVYMYSTVSCTCIWPTHCHCIHVQYSQLYMYVHVYGQHTVTVYMYMHSTVSCTCIWPTHCHCIHAQYSQLYMYMANTLSLYTCTVQSAVHGALCLECRVSWVRVPPEAAHFF